MDSIFVYGSLRATPTRSAILGRKIKTTKGVLNDYKLTNHSYFKVYPTIKKEVGEMVTGEIFEVTDEDLIKLDHYETNNYRRIKVKLASGDNVITYIEQNH